MDKYLREPEVLFGCALSILGLYILAQSSKWAIYGADGPGPGFFPMIYGVIMVGAALVLTFNSIRACKAKARPREAAVRGGSLAALATWIALAASLPLMAWFGFLIGFGLVLFFIIKVVFERPPLNAAITAGIIVAVLQVAFADLLQSPLPIGTLTGF
ncbi:hypothetical protein N825_24470 [Skermanella stibiiresistens SB22]|uniref:DUF1468 domain-containing protein n=1 Tax=Skermanella stibiiresistens SB22 TaxID=1385369 RepID=W9HD68_9PROT|nr:tripartite tricarboxylate transporter TctB family protein [Skermanella stibiiresistens]EWY41848.1 hypothetical protein N825_24470 [Skermanella stibiiresistens SB22]